MSSSVDNTMAPRQRDFDTSAASARLQSSVALSDDSSTASMTSSSSQPRNAASSLVSRMRRKQARGQTTTTSQNNSSTRPGVEFVREQACGDAPAWAGQPPPQQTRLAATTSSGPSTIDAYVVPGSNEIAIATPIEQPNRPLAGLFLQRRRSQPMARASRPRLLQRGRGRSGRTSNRNSMNTRTGSNRGLTSSMSAVSERGSVTTAVTALNESNAPSTGATPEQEERPPSPVLTGCRRVSSVRGRSLLDDDDDDDASGTAGGTPSTDDPLATFQQQDRYLAERQNQRLFEQHMSRFQQAQQVQYDATMNHVMQLFPHVSKDLVVDLLRQRSLTSAVCLLSQSTGTKTAEREPQTTPKDVDRKPSPPGAAGTDEGDSKPSADEIVAAPTAPPRPSTTFGRADEEEQDALLGQMMEMFPHMDASIITSTMLKHSMQQSIHRLLTENSKQHSSDPNLSSRSAISDPDAPLPPPMPQKSLSSTDLRELLASARKPEQNDLPSASSNSTLYPSLSGL